MYPSDIEKEALELDPEIGNPLFSPQDEEELAYAPEEGPLSISPRFIYPFHAYSVAIDHCEFGMLFFGCGILSLLTQIALILLMSTIWWGGWLVTLSLWVLLFCYLLPFLIAPYVVKTLSQKSLTSLPPLSTLDPNVALRSLFFFVTLTIVSILCFPFPQFYFSIISFFLGWFFLDIFLSPYLSFAESLALVTHGRNFFYIFCHAFFPLMLMGSFPGGVGIAGFLCLLGGAMWVDELAKGGVLESYVGARVNYVKVMLLVVAVLGLCMAWGLLMGRTVNEVIELAVYFLFSVVFVSVFGCCSLCFVFSQKINK